MPSASRSTTPVGIDMDVSEGRYAELDDHTVSFETFKQDLDVAALLPRRTICGGGPRRFSVWHAVRRCNLTPGLLPIRLHAPYDVVDEPPLRARLAAVLARCGGYANEPHRARPFAIEALHLADRTRRPCAVGGRPRCGARFQGGRRGAGQDRRGRPMAGPPSA
jgi:hypothetical protein